MALVIFLALLTVGSLCFGVGLFVGKQFARTERAMQRVLIQEIQAESALHLQFNDPLATQVLDLIADHYRGKELPMSR